LGPLCHRRYHCGALGRWRGLAVLVAFARQVSGTDALKGMSWPSRLFSSDLTSAKIFVPLLLAASAAMLFFQLFFFTTVAEQMIGTVVGTAIYAVTILARGRYVISVRVGWAIVAGVILGVLPPRLHLSKEPDAFVVVYPLIHVVLLTGFVSFYRGAGGKRGRH